MRTKTAITSIGKGIPEFCYSQEQILDFMSEYLSLDNREKDSLARLYSGTAIGSRYSVLPDFGSDEIVLFDKEKNEPFLPERMNVYYPSALQLSASACRQAMEEGDIRADEVTHLILVSCTGLSAPGLDIALVQELGLENSVHRTAINFMGCYAAFNGLKVTDSICKADPDAVVLMVCVELCSIHFQRSKVKDHIIAHSLFADGAAAIVAKQSTADRNSLFELVQFECGLFPSESPAMAWNIGTYAFDMLLSAYVPELLEKGIGSLLSSLVEKSKLEKVDHYAIHPGGRKILEAVESALQLTSQQLRASYEVLHKFGNMSSPTILFVLDSLTNVKSGETILGAAFGPGLTVESMMLVKS